MVMDVPNNTPHSLAGSSIFYVIQFPKSSSSPAVHIAPAAVPALPVESYLSVMNFHTAKSTIDGVSNINSMIVVAVPVASDNDLYITSPTTTALFRGSNRLAVSLYGVDYIVSWLSLSSDSHYELFTAAIPFGKFGVVLYTVCGIGKCTGARYAEMTSDYVSSVGTTRVVSEFK